MPLYSATYQSHIGSIQIVADEAGITHLGFDTRHHTPDTRTNGVIVDTVQWLDAYFAGKTPTLFPRLNPYGTEYQKRVWQELTKIPYGSTATYADIARTIDSSPRAVGQAVGANPIAIIIPCHRVVAAKSLGGYYWGIEMKQALLRHEIIV